LLRIVPCQTAIVRENGAKLAKLKQHETRNAEKPTLKNIKPVTMPCLALKGRQSALRWDFFDP
jgi:hypothetical protein